MHGFANTKLGTGHWNETGHQLAGQLIADRLCDLIQTSHTRICRSHGHSAVEVSP